tara:strand:+ start:194 stop:796 length:603 start_codon:yes stop_codon:yes gene_type:complete
MLLRAKTKLSFSNEWLDKLKFQPHIDQDLAGNCDAIAVKSGTGSVFDFYRGNGLDPFENPEEYKYTKLYEQLNDVKKLVDYFQFCSTRVRIHKQAPGNIIPLHVDENNWFDTPPDKYMIRSITALTADSNFIYKFIYKDKEYTYNLEQGETIIFDPDFVQHGMDNKSTDKTRYALVHIFRAYPVTQWFKSFVYDEKVITL